LTHGSLEAPRKLHPFRRESAHQRVIAHIRPVGGSSVAITRPWGRRDCVFRSPWSPRETCLVGQSTYRIETVNDTGNERGCAQGESPGDLTVWIRRGDEVDAPPRVRGEGDARHRSRPPWPPRRGRNSTHSHRLRRRQRVGGAAPPSTQAACLEANMRHFVGLPMEGTHTPLVPPDSRFRKRIPTATGALSRGRLGPTSRWSWTVRTTTDAEHPGDGCSPYPHPSPAAVPRHLCRVKGGHRGVHIRELRGRVRVAARH